jgi:Nucleoside 2-deoxyribosyltransferase
VPLTTDQQQVIQAVYDVFRVISAWPVVDAIDRLADERWELDGHAVLRSLPEDLALLDRRNLRDNTPVCLRVRAIAMCAGSDADLAIFVRAVGWLAERERAFHPSSPQRAEQVCVTSSQLESDLAAEGRAIDSLALAKVWELADVERLSWGGSYGSEGGRVRWEMYLRRDIRPFRRVETLEDFLEVRDRLDEQAAKEARRAPGVDDLLALGQPRAPETPADDRRYVFVAMPFEEPWSQAVRDLIEQACERVHDAGIPLRWERADEIDRPGHITEQILDALSTADVVIADITGANTNVIYEVGYAAANGIPVVLLSQEPGASPFDLKDLRQIEYKPDELDAARGKLARQLHGALGTEATQP